MSQKIFLLTFKGICMNFLLELNFFYFKSPSDLSTASQNRSDTYGSPCTQGSNGIFLFLVNYQSITKILAE